MTTRFVGLKELRQNMSRISMEALKKGQRLIVLRKNEPIFELRPLSKKEKTMEQVLRDVERGREDVRMGRVYTLEEVERRFGL